MTSQSAFHDHAMRLAKRLVAHLPEGDRVRLIFPFYEAARAAFEAYEVAAARTHQRVAPGGRTCGGS